MIEITEKELELLKKFREQLNDVLESEYKRSDGYLVPWIRSSNYDLTKAEKAFRKMIKWRIDYKIDGILEEDMGDFPELFPFEFVVDKGGLPVVLVPWGKWDLKYQVEHGNRDKMLRYMLQWSERLTVEIQKQAEKTNSPINQFVGIFDMKGYSFKQMASTKTIGILTDISRIGEANYPNLLSTLYVTNAPNVIKVLVSMVKPFLRASTMSVFKLFNSDRKDWEPVLLDRVSSSELPVYFGGTRQDSIFNSIQFTQSQSQEDIESNEPTE